MKYFNQCLRQEQIDVEHLLFSALHLHLTNWSRCDGAGSRSVMIGAREFSLSFQTHSNESRFIYPIDSHVTTCRSTLRL